jgi:hypothetical protein
MACHLHGLPACELHAHLLLSSTAGALASSVFLKVTHPKKSLLSSMLIPAPFDAGLPPTVAKVLMA